MMRQFAHYHYISFDIFDTLIKRSVSIPSDLFLLMEQQYDQRIGVASNFAKKRIKANQICESRNGGKPACLVDIYNELRNEFGLHTDKLMEMEIQMEIDGCRPNIAVVDIFKQCVTEGKTVVLISDMYLPVAIINRMLKKCDIHGYKKIYVSCEEEARKRDGELFHKVIDDLGIKPSQLLHIGDSWKSDFIQAICAGSHANHVRNDQKKVCKVPGDISQYSSLSYRTISACIRNCSMGLSEYEKQGCAIFGPLLLGFTQWLIDRLRQEGIKDVFFLARDGYTMKRAFDYFAPDEFTTHYIHSSRRAVTVPLYWKESSLIEIFASRHLTKNGRISIRAFLDVIGLEPERYKERISECGLNIDKIYSNQEFVSDPSIINFYSSVKKDMEINSRQEYEALLKYLRSYKLHGRRIAVVDLGHQGTIQHALVKIFAEAKIDVAVKGYYVGLCPSSSFVQKGKIDAEGYLYDIGKNEKLYSKVMWAVNILETLFCETSGSTKRYVLKQGKGTPEFSENIYTNATGRLINESSVINDYQNGAQKLIEYYHDAYPDGTYNIENIEPEVAISRMVRLGLTPTLREARLWGNFRLSKLIDNGNQYMAKPKSWWFYLRHPEQFKNDIVTSWRIGFLKRMFLLPLPYEKIYYQLENVYMKNLLR